MRLRKLNDEVLVAEEPIVRVSGADIAALKQQALTNPRQRIRICTHPDTGDRLHEMLIVHTRGSYVRPHKHLNKSEAVHIIEGEVDVVFLDEAGTVSDVVRLGDDRSGREFYYRVGSPLYHTLLIASEFLVFHEITNGCSGARKPSSRRGHRRRATPWHAVNFRRASRARSQPDHEH